MPALPVSAESLPGLLLRKSEKLKQAIAGPAPIRDMRRQGRGLLAAEGFSALAHGGEDMYARTVRDYPVEFVNGAQKMERSSGPVFSLPASTVLPFSPSSEGYRRRRHR